MNPPDKDRLKAQYDADYKFRQSLIKDLETYLESLLKELPSNLTIKGRIKNFKSYYQKIIRYLRKKEESGDKEGNITINDKIGVRIICPFLEDIAAIEDIIKKKFEVQEIEIKGSEFSFKEFGYESHHILIKIPGFLWKKYKTDGEEAETAEIQVRTILQEAWAEVEHEFIYKAEFTPFGAAMRRKLAAINANLSLTDTLFQEFRTYQRQLSKQILRRRAVFFEEIESSIDGFIDEGGQKEKAQIEDAASELKTSDSIDDLLLNALYAHNKKQFDAAQRFYSRILELKPDNKIRGIIYQHRGLAYFAQSKYGEAISDFKSAIKYNEDAHTPYYYLGIVNSCLKNYAEALEAFSKSVELNPFRKYGFFRRAEVYYHLKDYPAAISDCEAALALDGNFEAARKLRALLLSKMD